MVPKAMRTLFTILLIATTALVPAQDWALLNPAYRYNYSNDGTDTISNQIRVMGVDTLGVDSFRYSLNQIALRCDTCGSNCQLRIRVPQFLLSTTTTSTSFWEFRDPGLLVIRPQAALSETWIFDYPNNVTGTLTGLVEQQIFGITDSVRTMTTSLGDTVRWSKNFGILHWHMHDGPTYQLIGVHGPDTGVLIPSVRDFFPYQSGDVVEIVNFGYSNFVQSSTRHRLHIEQRSEIADGVVLSGYSHVNHYGDNGVYLWTSHAPFEWVIDSLNWPVLRVLHSAPQQLVKPGPIDVFTSGEELDVVAKHRIDGSGNYVIGSDSLDYLSVFLSVDAFPNDCVPMLSPGPCENALRFTQNGLNVFVVCSPNSMTGFATWGVVLGGDTTGTINSDEYYHVGINEMDAGINVLFPVPANDILNIPKAKPGSIYTVIDLQGRMVTTSSVPFRSVIDVRQLQPGTFILLTENSAPQRFIIAR